LPAETENQKDNSQKGCIWAMISAQDGNSEVPVYFLKVKQEYIVRNMSKDE
jgi:hypothetical protein